MKILIVDDEAVQRELLKGFLEKAGHVVFEAEDGEHAVAIFREEPIDLVLMDQKMPGMSGEETLKMLKEINPLVRCIMITAFGSVSTAVNVMKIGADDFLEKPVDLEFLAKKIEEIEQELQVEKDIEEVEKGICDDESPLPIEIIAESRAMKNVLSMVRRVSPTPWTVLIRGETGTGKELIARLIHLLSERKHGPFVEVNCATIPENLFESELFGHEKGAFTGAVSRRTGLFESANGGSIFLDEIGELPLNLQPKLLRALQEKRISRVGSSEEIDVDVRVIAATNRDLRKMVEEERFREDLYFRLNVFEITLPPLRSRKEDIPKLIEFFKSKYALRDVRFSKEAVDVLMKYSFPGNVRELEHIVQRTITLARSNVIRPSDLPQEVRIGEKTAHGPLKERLEAMEKEMILNALQEANWVQTRAAEQLGISERVLRYKIERLGIKKQGKK
ncbi:Response regulator of zinc sigma-54-dependent two-component system [Dissulfuribacter thermophilus]|uniref:Response regulator of zinc sigma-54-dependent two-component system n=1 Tax=Dissulfuribacter thermophilus TaxID=1156395 RepID=A0A1B9F3A3_9BACT|nr:sigma-54 dependent transcriptional regulator [Dissulfuribacter thermophilus]OCC14295.1 Response regulator of zinc sigma-54-dependent two-component system [Dissulfuribacter thermophilus]